MREETTSCSTFRSEISVLSARDIKLGETESTRKIYGQSPAGSEEDCKHHCDFGSNNQSLPELWEYDLSAKVDTILRLVDALFPIKEGKRGEPVYKWGKN